MDLDRMRRGGYPFGKDDLTIDEWMALAVVAEERESAQWAPRKSVSAPTEE